MHRDESGLDLALAAQLIDTTQDGDARDESICDFLRAMGVVRAPIRGETS
jgi:hypothetical protein